ncbi:MAG: PAS-domain containing protein [Minwuia sp.]|uniref:PAS-domain containing protein n=1 Tax=Minwuia sp. TaxID=2493630 RepID=UPI003A86D6AF
MAVVFSAIFVVFIGGFLLWYESHRRAELEAELAAEVASVGFNIATAVAAAAEAGRSEDLGHLLRLGQGLRSVRCVTLLDAAGKVIESWPTDSCAARAAKKTAVFPVRGGGDVRIDHGGSWVRDTILYELQYVGAALGLSLLTALLASILTNHMIVQRRLQPVLRAASQARADVEQLRRIAEQDDEIGKISAAFVQRIEAERAAAEHEQESRLQDQRSERDRLMASIFDTLSEGLLTHDLNMKIVGCNAAVCRQFGYTEAEFLKLHVSDLMPPEQFELYNQVFQAYLAGAIPLPDRQTTMTALHKSGRRLMGDISFSETVIDGERLFTGVLTDRTAEREAQETARMLQERLLAAIEAVPDGFVLFDAEDRMVICNEKYREMYGRSADMMTLGTRFEDGLRAGVGRGEYLDAVGREEEWIAQRMAAHHNPPDEPIEQQLANGRWIRITERRTPEGGIVGFRTDITELKQREFELSQAQERLVSAIEAVPDAFVVYDADDRLVICNQKYRETYDKSADLMVQGTLFADIIHHGAWRGQYPAAIGREEEWIAERMAAHRNPPEKPIEQQLDGDRWLSIVERRTPDGGTVGFRTDITELKRREFSLRESEGRIRATIDAALDCIIIMDRDGNVVRFNPAAEKLFGYDAAAVVGKEMADLVIPPDLREAHRKGLAHYLVSGEGPVIGNRIEIEAMDANGRIFPIELAISVADGRGGPEFIGYLRDITELRDARAELTLQRDRAEEANRAKSRFLAMMSHEIRTPLNAVLGVLGLLTETPLSGDQEKYVTTGRRSAEALLTVINDILDFSKMEAGKLELEVSPFDPADLVRLVMEVLEPRVREKGVDLRLEADPDLPAPLLGDPGRMRQVLLNFGSNAARFTQQGEIVFRVEQAGGHKARPRLRFSVTDSGSGVSEEVRDRLFTEFATTGDGDAQLGGTGLGLAICKRIVDAIGGEIGFESERGRGSTFWFEADLERASLSAPAEAAAGPAIDDADTIARRSHVRLLVAEDNPANQMVVQVMLQKAGFAMDLAGNGAEAVEAVERRPYHAVLMDIGMPVMDGLEATSAIRALPGERGQVPIIAMTAHVLESEKSNILASGMDDFVAKPIDRAHLIRTIDRWVLTEAPVPEAVAPEPQHEHPLFDPEVLDRLAEETSPEVIPQMLQVFTEHLTESLPEIEAASASHDAASLDAVAHRIGSSSGSFGAMQLFRTCRAIEAAVAAGNEGEAFQLAAGLPELARRSMREMEGHATRHYGN